MFFAAHDITPIRRVLTDNGACYRPEPRPPRCPRSTSAPGLTRCRRTGTSKARHTRPRVCLSPRLHVRARTPRRAQRSTTDQPDLGGATTASCSTNRQSCSTPSHSTSRSRTPRHQPHATAHLVIVPRNGPAARGTASICVCMAAVRGASYRCEYGRGRRAVGRSIRP